jgi:putative flippase GtrA
MSGAPGHPRSALNELARYVAVSAVALLIDVAALAALVAVASLPAAWATALGYGVGLLAHYALSVHFVFAFRRLAERRTAELAIYFAAGVAGAALSAAVVHYAVAAGATLVAAKALAVAAAFATVFALRKALLFSDKGVGAA